MKKIVLALLIAMLVAGGAFAVDFALSAGVGGLLTMDFGGGVKNKVVYDVPTSNLSDFVNTNTITYPYLGYGGYVFLDATYAELNIGYIYALGTADIDRKYVSGNRNSSSEDYSTSLWLDYSMINFSLLGKFPIALSDDFTLFPLIGVDYRWTYAVDSTYSNYNFGSGYATADYFSQIWFKGGLGLDWNLPVSDVPMYIRLEALFGVRLPTAQEDKDGSTINSWTSTWYNYSSRYADRYTVSNEGNILGMGLTFKLAVGYKF